MFKHRMLDRMVTLLIVALVVSTNAVAQDAVVRAEDPAEKLANEILSKMTLAEKVSLCHGNSTFYVNAIPRVGINKELALSDGPHNVRPEANRDNFGDAGRHDDYSTSMPTLSALAATWNPADATRFGDVIGEEARDRGKDVMLGPGVNIMRTPLNGRNFEYMGEDPALASAMVVPLIRAVQTHDVASCVKHFALNNQELNRGEVNVEVDERTLREIYLPAFHAAVVDGGALSVMNAYNRFRDEWCSHNSHLNNDILKGEWGFKGFVVTDWGSMHNTVKGALGGTDLEMNSGLNIRYFKQPLLNAVREGEVSEEIVNDKARRILYVMAKLHMIDGVTRKPGSRNTPAHQTAAREIAEDAIVLLKNDRNVLPLDKSAVKKILVVGNNAIRKHCTEGQSAMGKPLYEVTPLEGLKNLLGHYVNIEYAQMPNAESLLQPIPTNCLTTTDPSAGSKGWAAEFFNNEELKGAPVSTRYDAVPDFAWNGQSPNSGVEATHFSARWTATVIAPETGDYQVGVNCDDGGRLFVDDKLVTNAWELGPMRSASGTIHLEAGKSYVFRGEYFQAGGSSGFAIQWFRPSDRADSPLNLLVKKARNADAVLVFTGTDHDIEEEGGDRRDIKLPAGQDDMVKALMSANRRTIVVNLSGSPVEMPWVADAKTIVQYWFSGMEGGNALAKVLFGQVNPSGKLPFTFPVKLTDSPAHALGNYNADNVTYAEGVFVGYRWADAKDITPLFPFGHGLSYTTFEIGSPDISAKKITNGGSTIVKVKVTNTGKRAGAEVVQLYVAEEKPSVPRPPKELKTFSKVFLQPGESKIVELPVTAHDLAFWDETTNGWKTNVGKFDLLIGNSSRNITRKVLLTIE